jgi:hypothetical protein
MFLCPKKRKKKKKKEKEKKDKLYDGGVGVSG